MLTLFQSIHINKFNIPPMLSLFALKPGIFVERKTLLMKVEAILSPSDSCKGSKNILTLYGMAGSGKTELALHYWRKNNNLFSITFKVFARLKEEFLQDFLIIHASILPHDPIDDSIHHEAQAKKAMQNILQWFNQADNSY